MVQPHLLFMSFIHSCLKLTGFISLLLSAARGIQHLHSLGILHRDIRLPNILILPNALFNSVNHTAAQVACVCDLGLACNAEDVFQDSNHTSTDTRTDSSTRTDLKHLEQAAWQWYLFILKNHYSKQAYQQVLLLLGVIIFERSLFLRSFLRFLQNTWIL